MNLEQLIEACGENLGGILRYPNYTTWSTIGYNEKGETIIRTKGSTPTECVQKLYDYLIENNLLNTEQS